MQQNRINSQEQRLEVKDGRESETPQQPHRILSFIPEYGLPFHDASSSFAADAAAPVWRRDIWSGDTLVWRYPSTDAKVGGTTRIYCKPSGLNTIRAFEGSLGLALVEMERSEYIDITDLLSNSYLANQYDSVRPFVGQGLQGWWVDATHDMLLGNGDFSVLIPVPCDVTYAALGGLLAQEEANFYAFMGVVEDCVPCRKVDVCCNDACCSDILCCFDPTCCEALCVGTSFSGTPCCACRAPSCATRGPVSCARAIRPAWAAPWRGGKRSSRQQGPPYRYASRV